MRVLQTYNFAFISKPRCGSTSVRNVITKHMREKLGFGIDLNPHESLDFGIDIATPASPYHPHITAPHLKKLLHEKNSNAYKNIEYLTVIRHPIEMLKSYFKYFQPDINSNYNYSQNYNAKLISFPEWITNGRVGIHEDWYKSMQQSISSENLSPLSLEAHGYDQHNKNLLTRIFLIEEPLTIELFLSEKFGEKIVLPNVNKSSRENLEKLSDGQLERIRIMFPTEASLYNI